MAGISRAMDLIARIGACDAKREAAMLHYIAPHAAEKQELLTELGAVLSGFAIGQTIYSPNESRTVTITGFTAAMAGGSYYWIARGMGPAGPTSAQGIFPNAWQLADPPHRGIIAPNVP